MGEGSISVDVHTKLDHQIRTHTSQVEGEQHACFLSQTISLHWCKVKDIVGHEAGSGSAQLRPPAGRRLCC